MKRYLLPENGAFYKANLHCHSTISDGKATPEELKALYMEKGYSVLAYTEHDIMIPHPELADEEFLPLSGYEMEFNDETDEGKAIRRTCHLCFIAPTLTDTKQVCWHRKKYLFGNAPNYRDAANIDECIPDFERTYSPECINEAIKTAKDAGYFVTYNHPTWSREAYPQYTRYEGFDALEIMNYCSQVAGYDDYNPRVYDDLLSCGKRIAVTGGDDNHNGKPKDSNAYDAFGAFTMIKAEKLDYDSVFSALVKGDFYASEGPLINALWYENGIVYVETSDAYSITFVTNSRPNRTKMAEGDTQITSAFFGVAPQDDYFRIVVLDKFGKHACSRAYFVDEIK